MEKKIRVLFVCMGNICRSPLAEGVFAHLLTQAGLEDQFECDSAGVIGYHAGELPDPRSIRVAAEHGIRLTHRSRKINNQDFEQFDYILGMDDSNLYNIRAFAREANHNFGDDQLLKMRQFDASASLVDVDDPYYGTYKAFEKCYDELLESCSGFLEWLKQKHHLGK